MGGAHPRRPAALARSRGAHGRRRAVGRPLPGIRRAARGAGAEARVRAAAAGQVLLGGRAVNALASSAQLARAAAAGLRWAGACALGWAGLLSLSLAVAS